MSLYQLKSQFQNQLRPVSDALVKHHCTANQVTISAALLSIGTAYLIAKPAKDKPAIWLSLPLSLFVRMALNAIDGMMAREHGQASPLGAVLNEAGDVIADTALIVSLQSHLEQQGISGLNSFSTHQQHMVSMTALSISTELLAIISNICFEYRANQGPLGKSDRAFLLGSIGAWMGMPVPRLLTARGLSAAFVITEALLLKTCLNRLHFMANLYLQRQPPTLRRAASSHFLDTTAMPISKSPQPHPSFTSSDSTPITGESCFNAYDGTALYYRYWLSMPLAELKAASNTQALRQVILLHRGHEHSGRLAALGQQFAAAGYQVFAWDARGNGRSGGIKDHADSVTELERDLDDFVQLIIAQTGIGLSDTLVVASSIGAVLAAAWVHDYAPTIRAMILGTPALRIRLYMPLAIPTLKVARGLGLMARVSSYVKAQVLTHDKAAQQAYNADPLISSSISTDLLLDTHATGQRLLDDAAAITVPTFILCAGKDYVVDKQAERDFYEALATPTKRWQLYPDSYHALFHETNQADVIDDCLAFAEQIFAAPPSNIDLSHAHLDSASKDKVDRLAIKPFNANFALTRFAMQKFGRVSAAIATGLEHGFDSGSSLDKVYDNQPSGRGVFGRAVDKFYLNNIGWQGIRIRREHLLELARIALADMQSTPMQSPRVLDIASGHGAYVFDLLTEFTDLHAELRDYETHNVQALAAKAERLDISERVCTVQKDAFAVESYVPRADDDAFDMAIASGVFELFSNNALLHTALAGIYDSLKTGGYLIYTNQPWHPEQEFISKTLNNHRGSSWVMRCRSQAEMDQLVQRAGFTKVDMRIDRFGIFTVSLAIKSIATEARKTKTVNADSAATDAAPTGGR